jgi:CheY-like chemotaxis protein
VLRELHYDVTTAVNGEEALDLFSRHHFDLVITDHRMPRMSGVELIRHLKEMRPSIPVVLLSGFVDPLGLNEQSTGADVVISKSANEVGHLVRAAAKLLSRRRKPPESQRRPGKAKAESAS